MEEAENWVSSGEGWQVMSRAEGDTVYRGSLSSLTGPQAGTALGVPAVAAEAPINS